MLQTCMHPLRAVLAPLVLALLSLPARADVELRFASSAPPTSPWARQIDRHASTVIRESKGVVRIKPYYNSQLGAEHEALDQVARGGIEMGFFTLSAVALRLPEIALLQLPMYFASTAERDCVLDHHVHRAVHDALARQGLKFIAWGEVGPVHLPGKSPYATPADVRGLKVGIVDNRLNRRLWQALGAEPVPTAVDEAAASVRAGRIDTYPTPFAFYIPSGLHKAAPTMTRLPLSDAAGLMLMHKPTYDQLPPEGKAAIERANARHPATLLRKEIRAMDGALAAAHKAAGGTVADATPAQRADWRKALAGFWPTMARELGPDGETLFAQMEAGRRACEQAR